MNLCEIEHPCTINCINLNWQQCVAKLQPSIIITNPHACCSDEHEQKCDQISRKRRNQMLKGSSHHDVRENNEMVRIIHSKQKNIIGILPLNHRHNMDLNRIKSKTTLHFRIFDYIYNINPHSVILDVHSYSLNHTWGKKTNKDTDLVILYSKYGVSKIFALILKQILQGYNVVLVLGADNILIDEASKKNHIALLLEFPEKGTNKKYQKIIKIIMKYFNDFLK